MERAARGIDTGGSVAGEGPGAGPGFTFRAGEGRRGHGTAARVTRCRCERPSERRLLRARCPWGGRDHTARRRGVGASPPITRALPARRNDDRPGGSADVRRTLGGASGWRLSTCSEGRSRCASGRDRRASFRPRVEPGGQRGARRASRTRVDETCWRPSGAAFERSPGGSHRGKPSARRRWIVNPVFEGTRSSHAFAARHARFVDADRRARNETALLRASKRSGVATCRRNRSDLTKRSMRIRGCRRAL